VSFNNKEIFCLAPFLTKKYFYDYASICPMEERDSCFIERNNLHKRNIEDILNDEYYTNFRKNILNNNLDSKTIQNICKTCIYYAKNKFYNARELLNNIFKEDMGSIISNIDENGKIKDIDKLFLVSVTTDNLCNSRCRFCDPERSHLLVKEFLALGLTFERFDGSSPITKMSSTIYDSVIKDLRKAKYIHFNSSGEPFISKAFYQFTKKLIEENNTDKTIILYSNLSRLKTSSGDASEILSKFKKVILFASIDGINEYNNLIRDNLDNNDFNKIVSNLEIISKLSNVTICLSPTLSILNYYNIFDYHKFFVERGLIKINDININPIFNQHISINNLPYVSKNKIFFKVKKHILWLKEKNALDLKNLHGIKLGEMFKNINLFVNTSECYTLKEIKSYLEEQDRFKKLNCFNLKEIKDIYRE